MIYFIVDDRTCETVNQITARPTMDLKEGPFSKLDSPRCSCILAPSDNELRIHGTRSRSNLQKNVERSMILI